MCSLLGQRKALRRYLGHLEFLGSAFLKLGREALRHFEWLDNGIFIQRSGIYILFLALSSCSHGRCITSIPFRTFYLFSHTPEQPAMELSAAQLEDAVIKLKRLCVIYR